MPPPRSPQCAPGHAVGVDSRRNAALQAWGGRQGSAAGGGGAVAVQGNVAAADVARLFDEVAGALWTVTALVNNAGTTGRVGR